MFLVLTDEFIGKNLNSQGLSR